MSEPAPRQDGFELVVLLLVYVLPLGVAAAFLTLVDLPGLALGLLAVEALVGSAVLMAKRPAGTPRAPGTLVVALLLLAAAAGVGSAVLLTAGRG